MKNSPKFLYILILITITALACNVSGSDSSFSASVIHQPPAVDLVSQPEQNVDEAPIANSAPVSPSSNDVSGGNDDFVGSGGSEDYQAPSLPGTVKGQSLNLNSNLALPLVHSDPAIHTYKKNSNHPILPDTFIELTKAQQDGKRFITRRQSSITINDSPGTCAIELYYQESVPDSDGNTMLGIQAIARCNNPPYESPNRYPTELEGQRPVVALFDLGRPISMGDITSVTDAIAAFLWQERIPGAGGGFNLWFYQTQ
jgi:hypothetical protein